MTSDPEDPRSPAAHRASPIGMLLFAVYLALYAGFMALNVIDPFAMSRPLGPLNIAVAYGFALIVIAFVLAVVYARLAGSAADRS